MPFVVGKCRFQMIYYLLLLISLNSYCIFGIWYQFLTFLTLHFYSFVWYIMYFHLFYLIFLHFSHYDALEVPFCVRVDFARFSLCFDHLFFILIPRDSKNAFCIERVDLRRKIRIFIAFWRKCDGLMRTSVMYCCCKR